MLQEQKKETPSSAKQPWSTLGRSKEQSLKTDRPTVYPPKVTYKRIHPVFPESSILSPPPTNDTILATRQGRSCVVLMQVSTVLSIIHVRATKPH